MTALRHHRHVVVVVVPMELLRHWAVSSVVAAFAHTVAVMLLAHFHQDVVLTVIHDLGELLVVVLFEVEHGTLLSELILVSLDYVLVGHELRITLLLAIFLTDILLLVVVSLVERDEFLCSLLVEVELLCYVVSYLLDVHLWAVVTLMLWVVVILC